MTPDFSPTMLRDFLSARISMAGFAAVFPHERRSPHRKALTFDAACAAERKRIARRADVSDDQLDAALHRRALGEGARVRLWQALGADPMAHGVRLVGAAGQQPPAPRYGEERP